MCLMHKVQVTPLIGLPQFDGWSQVATNTDSTLVVALAIGGVNAGNVGRDLVSFISQASPHTAAELHTLLLDTLHEATTVGSQIALAASCVIGEVSMFAAYQGAVVLKRGEKVGIIVSAPDSVKVIEGRHVVDDVIVLATNQAMTFLGEIQQKLTQGFDSDTIVTSLVSGLHAQPDSALTGLAFIGFEEKSEGFEKPLLEIEVESIPDDQPLIAAEEIVELPTAIPLATTPRTPDSLTVPARPLEVSISSDTTAKMSASFKPKLQGVHSQLHQLSQKMKKAWLALPALFKAGRRLGQPLFSTGLYVTSLPKRKLLQILIPLMVVILMLVGGFLFWRQHTAQQVQAAMTVLQPLTARFDEAKIKVADNPLEARSEMEHVLDEMQTIKGSFTGQGAALKVIETTYQATQAEFADLSGRDEISTLPVFFDLRTIQSDLLISKADADATRAALLDDGKKQVVLLNLADAQPQLLNVESLAQVVNLSLNPSSVVVLGSGIHQVPLSDLGSGLKVIKEEGDSNRDGILVGTFGQYVYVVNPVKRNIYRYSPDGEKYTDPIGWLKPGQSLPYDELNSLAIDGDVWLGTKDGQILKLTQGSQQTFEIKGLPEAFSGSLFVYTKETIDNIYVLEPAARRLVILRKTGEFIREIKSGSLASASSVFADETVGKAFVVNGSLIFEIAL